MNKITYPRKGLTEKDVLNQDLFDRMTDNIFRWQQGPGAIGSLCLHSCWGETSVLKRRYQGPSISSHCDYILGAMRLYERTDNPRWRRFANDLASNILFLQCEDGGFRHASAEFEPSFNSNATCPIHQNFPILALLNYAEWKHADPTLKDMIKPAVDKHWENFNGRWWCEGAGSNRPLKGAGWCGVTNQDLTVIAALSAYGRVYGDWSRYEKWGKPALDMYLSPKYYYENIGLLERGDGQNFVERTPYYDVILPMFRLIYADVKDERLPAVIDNIIVHLFDTAYTAPDGMTHMAWGAETNPDDKSYIEGWIKTPVVFGAYFELIREMGLYLEKHPDSEKEKILNEYKESFYAYVMADGTIPGALWPADPVISIALATNAKFWLQMINYLGDDLQDPKPVKEVCLHRTIGELTWKSKGALWSIEQNGERIYGGYRPLVFGVTHGQEPPAYGSFEDLDNCDILEILP